MHPRYSHPALENLYSYSMVTMVYISVLAEVARAQDNHRVADALLALDMRGTEPRLAELAEYQKHETAAFISLVREMLPEYANDIYIGMTSSDLIDTGEALLWGLAWRLVFRQEIQNTAQELLVCNLPATHRPGRTHGRLTGLDVTIRSPYMRASRDLLETADLIDQQPLRASLSGPVGQFSRWLTRPQAKVAAQALRLELDELGTQTADRHRMAGLAMQLVQLTGVIEQLATLHRLSSISGVDDFSEDFVEGQKGSSSMPHKHNPIRSEQLSGLGRIARGLLVPILETNHTQWWERDLSNSSVERVAWRDLVLLTGYMLSAVNQIDFSGWNGRPESTEGSSFDQLNQLIAINRVPPEEAYRTVQADTTKG